MHQLPHYIYRVTITHPDTVRIEKCLLSSGNYDGPPLIGTFQMEFASKALDLHNKILRGKRKLSTVAQELGEYLFKSLFVGPISDDFIKYYRKTSNEQNKIIRLELEIDEQHVTNVAALPWELMCVPPDIRQLVGKVNLATHPKLVFLRHKMSHEMKEAIKLAKGEELRIAFVVSSPEKLGVVKYESISQRVLELGNQYHRKIELCDLVNQVTFSKVEEVMKKRPHILHFIGHASIKGRVALNDITPGQPLWVDAELFSELLNRHTPEIVIFQACESGAVSLNNSSVISSILEKNVPVTIAMQYKVSNVTAQKFALRFYECLISNDAVEVAVQEGRRNISLTSNNSTGDFAIPIIYSHVKDARLFPLGISHPLPNIDLNQVLLYHKAMINQRKVVQKDYENLVKQRYISQKKCRNIFNHINNLVLVTSDIYKLLNNIPFSASYNVLLKLSSLLPSLDSTLSIIEDFYRHCPPRNSLLATSPTYQAKYEKAKDALNNLLEDSQAIVLLINSFCTQL